MRIDDFSFHLFEELRARRITRREFLRVASVMGISASAARLLSARGEAAAQAPAGPPKQGGTLKVAMRVPTASPDPVTMYEVMANTPRTPSPGELRAMLEASL